VRESKKQTGVKYAQFSLVGISNAPVDVGVLNLFLLIGPTRSPELLVERFRERVPEDVCGRRVPQYYLLGLGVRHDNSVPDPLEEPADAQVLRAQTLLPAFYCRRRPQA
jgi:hypothetical protein